MTSEKEPKEKNSNFSDDETVSFNGKEPVSFINDKTIFTNNEILSLSSSTSALNCGFAETRKGHSRNGEVDASHAGVSSPHKTNYGISLKEGERLDDLQIDGLKIVQNGNLYAFTSDAVFLANFVSGVRGKTVVDLGTGSGIVSILVAKKQSPKKIYGIELQTALSDMAVRSVALNGMDQVIEIVNRNMLDAPSFLGCEFADAVVCNPPYRKSGSGETQANIHLAICRHEIAITLREIVRIASRLLKSRGSFYAILRVERMAELFCLMKDCEIEPKEMKFTPGKAYETFVVRGIKHGKTGLKILY